MEEKDAKKGSFETGLFVASPSSPCFFFLFSMSGNTVDEKEFGDHHLRCAGTPCLMEYPTNSVNC